MFVRLCVGPRNAKEPLPFGSGSSTRTRPVNPSYTVEGTSWVSIWTQLKDWAFGLMAMARPRDVKRPSVPSECRGNRQLFA
jgi:hypothetical protein